MRKLIDYAQEKWDGLSKKHKIAAAVVILILIIAIIGG
jgi:flagellar biosynthesis/type III secretory pathway M-ring protein FliF/YscJ